MLALKGSFDTFEQALAEVDCEFMDVEFEYVAITDYPLFVKVPKVLTEDVLRVLDDLFAHLIRSASNRNMKAMTQFDRYFKDKGLTLGRQVVDIAAFRQDTLDKLLKGMRPLTPKEKAEADRKAQEKAQADKKAEADRKVEADKKEAEEQEKKLEEERERKRIERLRAEELKKQEIRDLAGSREPAYRGINWGDTLKVRSTGAGGAHGAWALHVDTPDTRCDNIPSIFHVLRGRHDVYVEAGRHLPEEYTKTVLDLYQDLLHRLQTTLCPKASWRAVLTFIPSQLNLLGYNLEGCLYYNIGCLPLQDCLKLRRQLLVTTIHELAHNVESDHNGNLGDIMHALTLDYADVAQAFLS